MFNDRAWFWAFGFSPAKAHWLLQLECDDGKYVGRPLYPLQWFLCAFLPTPNFLMADKKQIWAAWPVLIYKRTSLSGILRKREGWTEISGQVGYSPQTSCWAVFSRPYFFEDIIVYKPCKAQHQSNQTAVIAWRFAYINRNKTKKKCLLCMIQ